MASLNRVDLIGNIGKAPEIRHTQAGDPVASFSIATSEKWKNKTTGETQERTEWHNVVVFGALAGIVEKYANKGTKVYVSGQLRTRKWQDNEGRDRYSTEVVLQGFDAKLVLLGESSGGRAAPAESDYGIEDRPSPSADDFDDEIPF